MAWGVVLCIAFSLGDLFLLLYNRFSKNKEHYNFLDTFILGICFISFLISFSSLWFPSDQYVLLIYTIISIIYWVLNKDRLRKYFLHLKDINRLLSFKQKAFIMLWLSVFLVFLLFPDNFYDSVAYHRQQIRCNEDYGVIPGLGNIESRFGFNSNYLLLSSVFSFRFLFGEVLYGCVQSVLFALITIWVLVNLFRSGYSIIYIILMAFLYIIILTSSYMFTDSNTDVIPLLFVFYYIAKTILSPNWLIKQPLLSVLLPIVLITFKLSSVIFCLVSLGVLIYLVKQKKWRIVTFVIAFAFCIVSLWCIRNVIITGYLIYPFDAIDIFSFDWKMPKGTALLERAHVYHWAKYIYDVKYIYYMINLEFLPADFHFYNVTTNIVLFLIVLFSPLIAIYAMLKSKIDKKIYLVYWVSLLCIIFGIISAPDFRFFNQYIFGCVLIIYYVILFICNRHNLTFRKLGKITACILLVVNFSFVIIPISYNYDKLPENILQKICYLPERDQPEIKYSEFQVGNIVFYLLEDELVASYDLLPATSPIGLPFEPFMGYKIQSIKTIEPRGDVFQDGFRTKKEYIDIINENVGIYEIKYLTRYQEYYPQDFLKK